MADVENDAVAENPFMAHVEREENLSDQDVHEERLEPVDEEAKHDPKAEIEDQIADHEKWMADHSDDARAVQLRLQEVAVLQQKLIELEAADRGVGRPSESALGQNQTLHDV